MSAKEGDQTKANASAKRKLGTKGRAVGDIFAYRGQIPLSFRTKQPKLTEEESFDSDDGKDEAFERVKLQDNTLNDSLEKRESKGSDSEEDVDIYIDDKSVEDTSDGDIQEVHLNRSLSPPPTPEISTTALSMMIHERQKTNPRLRELDSVLDSLKRQANENSFSPSPDRTRPRSVINVDDMDILPSPSERNIAVKVRTRSGIKRFSMKAADSFGTILSQLADMEDVTEDKIMLSLGSVNILGYDTPASIHLSVADIIECVIMDSSAPGTGMDEEEDNKIEIKVQGNDSDSKKTFKTSKDKPLLQLMKQYCEFRSLPLSQLKFSFDGEELTGHETVEALDMEDGDVIDVQIRKKYSRR